MPKTDINMEELWQEVQSEIAAREFKVYPNYIFSSEHKAYWPKEEEIAKFLDLADALDRKIIYVQSTKFDSEPSILRNISPLAE